MHTVFLHSVFNYPPPTPLPAFPPPSPGEWNVTCFLEASTLGSTEEFNQNDEYFYGPSAHIDHRKCIEDEEERKKNNTSALRRSTAWSRGCRKRELTAGEVEGHRRGGLFDLPTFRLADAVRPQGRCPRLSSRAKKVMMGSFIYFDGCGVVAGFFFPACVCACGGVGVGGGHDSRCQPAARKVQGVTETAVAWIPTGRNQ